MPTLPSYIAFQCHCDRTNHEATAAAPESLLCLPLTVRDFVRDSLASKGQRGAILHQALGVAQTPGLFAGLQDLRSSERNRLASATSGIPVLAPKPPRAWVRSWRATSTLPEVRCNRAAASA